MTSATTPTLCSLAVHSAERETIHLRYFTHNNTICGSLRDGLIISKVDRNSMNGQAALNELSQFLFTIKVGKNDADAAPMLKMLTSLHGHSTHELGRRSARHLIQLIESYRPGDTLPLETTVPEAVAINPNTFRPDYKTVGPE